mmetsp:Transcript_80163/g.209069  ORF Transcript_80163/g.209069 Transcript_80163/m.209069 type:complete len:252 (-) Transcript_80163:989-1744(-)
MNSSYCISPLPSWSSAANTFSACEYDMPMFRNSVFISERHTLPSLLRSTARNASCTDLYLVVMRSCMITAMSLTSFSMDLSSISISGLRVPTRNCGPMILSKCDMKLLKSTWKWGSSFNMSNMRSATCSSLPKPRKKLCISERVIRPSRFRSSMRKASRWCLNFSGSLRPMSIMSAFSSWRSSGSWSSSTSCPPLLRGLGGSGLRHPDCLISDGSAGLVTTCFVFFGALRMELTSVASGAMKGPRYLTKCS